MVLCINMYYSMKKKKKETEQINDLEEKVGKHYDFGLRNSVYSNGEVDYIGIKQNGNIDLYEVKTTECQDNFVKAVVQLRRAEYYFEGHVDNLFIYFANTASLYQLTKNDR